MPNSESPPSTAQSWAPPKNPLPPHRLARLANALGVSTPMPAIHTPTPMLSPSYNGSSPALDQYRRSPTPSTASTFGFSPVTSKYLLHVIPPIHLPHDSFDSELTPPPSTASGYHTQFRRGTLVPVHSTFQSQLGAIAKEYALPSTAGLILYLVSKPRNSPPPSASYDDEDEMDEPGPRLSEDIWRHLWTRVVKTELRDDPSPPLLGLGISSLSNRSTPYLPQFPLPLLSTNINTALLTPSPTTPSSTSEPPARFHTKSAPPSSSSRSDAETPDTSQASSVRADSLDLPGLNSDAIIPILAKVEFDIDRRKAAWYEPWLRSRRLNHAKRKNSMTPVDDERRPPLPFRLGEKRNSRRYLPLSESPQSMPDSEEEEEGEGEGDDEEGKDPLADVFGEDADTWADIRASSSSSRPTNPNVVQLALTAAELDAEEDGSERDDDDDMEEVTQLMNDRPVLGVEIPGMQNSPSRKRAPPPTPLVLARPPSASTPTVPMPLPGVAPPSDEEENARLAYLDGEHPRGGEGENESDLLDVPRRSMYDPGKRRGDIYEDMDLGFEESSDDFDIDDPNDRRKSQIIMRAQLDEIEKNLAQFSPRMLRTDLEDQQMPTFTTASSSPNLSPPGSSSSAFGQYPPMPSSAFMPVSNADVFPPTPRLPNHPHHSEEEDSESDDLSQQAAWPAVPYNSRTERPAASPAAGQQHFPPQLAVNGVSASMPKRFLGTGGSSSRASSMHSTASSESELRKRDLAENYPSSPPAPYPAFTPSIGPKSSLNSPLIPLSPDPFGRHPSQAPEIPGPSGLGPGGKRTSKSYWESPIVIPAPAPPPTQAELQRKSSNGSMSSDPHTSMTGTSNSRFSTDSMQGAGGDASQKATNRTTLMSVKSIKNLWRKSQKKESISIPHGRGMPMESVNENAWSPLSPPLPTQRPGNPAVPLLSPPPMPSGNAGSNPPLGVPAPMRPNRPSMEDMELPDVDVQMPPMTPLSAGFPGRPVPRQGPTPPPLQSQPQPRPSLQERRPSNASSSQSSQDRRPSMSSDRRPSMSSDRRPSVSQERRPSQDASRRASPEGTPLHSPHPNQLGVPLRRPSPEQVPPLPHPARRPSDAQSQMSMPSHQPQMSMQSQMSIQSHQSHMSMHSQSQLIVPPPMLQSTRNTPIIATKAGPPRSAMNDGLLWDQESPYPTRMTAPAPARAPSVGSSASRPSSRPPSPPSGYQHHSPTPPPQNTSPPLPHNSPPLPHNSPPLPHNSSPLPRHSPPPMPPHPSPPIQEKERRNSVRKSILKWKSQTNGGTAVPAPLTPSSASFVRARNASMSGSPSQGSPMNLPIDIPPSPKIPEQFIASFAGNPPPPPAPPVRPNSAAIARRRLSAKMVSTSSDSSSSRRQSQHHRPRESTASSVHSEGTHESTSLDTSGFEIVSPKMSGTLSFPYTEMDHDRPLVDGVRM